MKKVLVIAEDKMLQSSMEEILEAEGYLVLSAPGGAKCVPIAKREAADLIICDITSSRIDGYGVIRHLRADKSLDRIPLIFIAPGSSSADVRTGMELGADDFLTKPVELADLSMAVATRLNRFDAIKCASQKSVNRADNKGKRIQNDTVMVKVDKRQELIKVSDILLIKARGGNSMVSLHTGLNLTVRRPLKKWLAVLPDTLFMGINRSTVVNISRIEKMEKWFKNSYVILLKHHDDRLVISRRYFRRIRERLGA